MWPNHYTERKYKLEQRKSIYRRQWILQAMDNHHKENLLQKFIISYFIQSFKSHTKRNEDEKKNCWHNASGFVERDFVILPVAHFSVDNNSFQLFCGCKTKRIQVGKCHFLDLYSVVVRVCYMLYGPSIDTEHTNMMTETKATTTTTASAVITNGMRNKMRMQYHFSVISLRWNVLVLSKWFGMIMRIAYYSSIYLAECN